MAYCSPQRFLPNSRNLFRTAVLTPSSVLPVENQVRRVPFRRSGTALAALTGIYTGFEPADFEIEILDTAANEARVSKPTFYGAGTGPLTAIAADGAQQIFTLECVNAGIAAAHAGLALEGVTIKASAEGTSGNNIRLTVDLSGLTFTDSNFTTITELEAGQGGIASPIIGEGYDFGAAVVSTLTDPIPASAPRIAFKGDSRVYTHFKHFSEGEWRYYFVPALATAVPKGTIVQTVTGGRHVAITDGSTTELSSATYPAGLITVYDLLYWIRTTSELTTVDGVVANDRSPTGQAAREINLRTDAHAGRSTGSGSTYATGVENVVVTAGAGQQLVTFECFAVTQADHPNARLGHALFAAKSSLRGDLGVVAEGVPFSFTDLSGLIPVKLPPGYGQDKGSIGAAVAYATRSEGETEPPICVAGLALGPDATDQSVTFVYRARPTGDCDCTGMTVPPINERCLGVPGEGGSSVSYQNDTNTRLTAFRLWAKELIRSATEYPASANFSSGEARFIENPVDGSIATPAHSANPTLSLEELVDEYEATIALIDPLPEASPDAYREKGMQAWDDAVDDLQDDIAAYVANQSPASYYLRNIPSNRYTAALKWSLASAGLANVGGADASTVSGDGCWRDIGDAAWWEDESGTYAPFFTNTRGYSSRKSVAGAYFSTHEFTFIINVDCPGDLKYGDSVTILIRDAGWGATYQLGDKLEVPIIAAQALYLTGGVAASPVQTWTLNGTVSGPLNPYLFNPDSPSAYSIASPINLTFLLVEGGVPFAKGDRFRWAVEGGHYRWRKDGGAWDGTSPPLAIPITSDALSDGLSLSFVAGAAASFVDGDVYKFHARQPWAVSNTQTPSLDVWKWDADESPSVVTFDADFGSVKQIDLFAMLHGIPEGATVTFSGGVAGNNEWTEPLTWRTDAIWKAMNRLARYVRIRIADGSAGGWIMWPWAGVPLTTILAAEFVPTIEHQVSRPSGGLQGGRHIGRGIAGEVIWTEAALHDDDIGWSVDAASGIRPMFDELKQNDDEPFLFIPQVTRVADPVVFARLASDALRFEDASRLNRNEGGARRWTVAMSLAPVYR